MVIWVTVVVGVYAGVAAMSPTIVVSAVPILVALGSGVANLVAGTAMHPGLQVVGAVDTDVAHVATHGAEVVHVNNWGGSRACRRVLQLGGVRDKGEEDGGSGGRGADCGCSIKEVYVDQTFVGVMVIFPTSGTGVRTGLALPFVSLLPFSSMR